VVGQNGKKWSVSDYVLFKSGEYTVSATGECSTLTELAARFKATRSRTLALCEPLTSEDMMVQSCPEASPAKWHLAHTAWFFESFILCEFLPGYRLFNSDFPWLFNSYYQSFAAFPEKRLRSSFSRPGIDSILAYRHHVDQGIEQLLDNLQNADPGHEALRRIELGVNHEEQHQELLLTDILHAFFTNPLRPAYKPFDSGSFAAALGVPGLDSESRESTHRNTAQANGNHPSLSFTNFPGGLHHVGHTGTGFCFDNERSRHRVWLEPYSLANRLVTCSEFAAFIADGGYRRPELWLSAGWDAVHANRWHAPLYWTKSGEASDADWTIFTLRGELALSSIANAPVSQVSYFEADAYARWTGHRLQTEFEWEAAAQSQPATGNLMESDELRPVPAADANGIGHIWGDCWQWTAGAYLPYPGFKPLPGSLGEYNGKFMSGQMVLRGGSCVTPAAHIRASYRNFFPPETRWQFSGIRLAS
jgi:ergothioneine biosynthesis protein EgtB